MKKMLRWPVKWLMLFCLLVTSGHASASDWTEGDWFYLYNVDADRFLVGANDWGTRASVGIPTEQDKFQVNALPNGYYQLKWGNKGNGVFIDSPTSAYVDMNRQGHNDWQLTKQDDGTYLISINPGDDTYGVAAYGKTYLGWNKGESTIVYPLLEQDGINYGGSWLFLTENEYIDEVLPKKEAKAQLEALITIVERYGLSVDPSIKEVYAKSIISVTLDELVDACKSLFMAIQTYADEADEMPPMDLTELFIKNATCDNAEYWTGAVQDGSQKPKSFAYQGSSYANGNVTINRFLENWTSGGGSLPATGISQELSSLFVGKYTLEADAIATQQSDDLLLITGVNLFAAGVEKCTTACSTGNGLPEHYAVDFMVIDETPVIGFEVLSTTNANWVGVDNFKLYYKGVDVSTLKEALRRQLVKAEAQEIDPERVPDPLLPSLRERLNAAIVDARQAMETAETKVELRKVATDLQEAMLEVTSITGAVTALKDSITVYRDVLNNATGLTVGAIEALKTSIEAAENWKSAGSMKEIVALQNGLLDYKLVMAAYANAKSLPDAYRSISAQFAESEVAVAYATALDAVAMELETATSVTRIESEVASLRSLLCTWLPQGKPLQGAFDLTVLMKNPNFSDNTPEGWVSTYPITANCHVAEVYQEAFAARQVLTGMPAGSYQLRLQGFQRTGSNVAADDEYTKGTSEVTASFSLNDAKKKLINVFAVQSDTACSGEIMNGNLEPNYLTSAGKYIPNNMSGCETYMNKGFYWNMLDYTLPEDGDLTIGVENTEYRSGSWTLFDNFRLLYNPAEIRLDENSTEAPVTKDVYATKVTTNRTLKAGQWSTLCLPFDLTEAQVANAGITAVQTLSGITLDGETGFVTFAPAVGMEAGKPYLVKVAKNTLLSFSDVLVKAAAPEAVEVDGAIMQGSYHRVTLENAYYISGDKFYFADVPVPSKGFRASIVLMGAAAVKSLVIGVDNATGVEDVKSVADVETPVDVYTLNGVRVKSGVSASQALNGLRKGVYIVNGKKVVK